MCSIGACTRSGIVPSHVADAGWPRCSPAEWAPSLSHHAAAALWMLRAYLLGETDVTVPRQRRSGPGVRFHHVRLPADEVTVLDGIPVTTMPRTLFDLAAVLDARQLERALNEADFLRLTDRLSLPDLLARYPRRPGAVNLRAALTARSAGATRTRSELEERFIRLLDRHAPPAAADQRPRAGPGRRRGGLRLAGRSGSSWSSTAAPPTPPPPPSRPTASAIGSSRPPAGASSGSHGGSSRTTVRASSRT